MKAWGWILIALGGLNFIAGMIGVANGYEVGGSHIGYGIGSCVLGGYLLHRAQQKKEENEHPDNWSHE